MWLMVNPWSCFLFQPVLDNWWNKGCLPHLLPHVKPIFPFSAVMLLVERLTCSTNSRTGAGSRDAFFDRIQTLSRVWHSWQPEKNDSSSFRYGCSNLNNKRKKTITSDMAGVLPPQNDSHLGPVSSFNTLC